MSLPFGSAAPVHIQTFTSPPSFSHEESKDSYLMKFYYPDYDYGAFDARLQSPSIPAGNHGVPDQDAAFWPSSFPSDTPLTALGKVRKRAPVACHSCRTSKVRCDGGRPICTNCTRKHLCCKYDAVAKHRGPDKKPGTRVRAPNGTITRKRIRSHSYKMDGPMFNDTDISNTAYRPGEYASTRSPGGFYNTQWATRRPSQTLSSPPGASLQFVAEQERQDLLSNAGSLSPLRAQTDATSFATTPTQSQLPSSEDPFFYLLGVSPEFETKLGPGQNTEALETIPSQSASPLDSSCTIVPPSAYPILATSILAVDRHRRHSEASSAHTEYRQDVSFIAREPSLRFSQDTWWDTVLSIYDPSSKFQAAQAAHADLQTVFKHSSSWLSFINVPLFFNMFYHPEHRAMMQPALVLGCLALAAHMQGSEMEGGELQRKRALKLRDLSQAAFDASYNAGWIDVPLAQASWIFALFESCAHAETSAARMTASVCLMDNVIHVLGLTYIDANNPRSPVFLANTIPVMGRREPEAAHRGPLPRPLNISPPESSGRHIQYQMTTQPTPFDSYREVSRRGSPGAPSRHCPCATLAMQSAPDESRSTPLWTMTPMWEQGASDAELRKDEARRLVWSALAFVGGDIGGRLALGVPLLDLELVKPQNFALLYPGENLYPRHSAIDAAYSGKESTWALYARTLHLWVTCTNYRDVASPSNDKADFAMTTWMETVAIEDALNEHHCDGEKSNMYLAREYIFIIRMYISYNYRRFVPVPQTNVNFSRLDRGRAMQWLQHQNNTALQLRAVAMADFNSLAAKLLLRRPYLIWWQMTQMRRALLLFEMDTSLTFAVDVALNMLPILLYLQEMWPCAAHRLRAVRLMKGLHWACQRTGRTVPSFSFSLRDASSFPRT